MNDDGSFSTPFFERLRPIVPLLEILPIEQIERDVIAAAEESGVSDMSVSHIHEVFEKLNGNRIAVISYVVNLTLAAEGLKAIPNDVIKRGFDHGSR